MALKEAVLGLLFDSPRTGYEIKRFYSETIMNFWNVSDGQLYPTLRRMREDGLVSMEVVPQANTADKHVYSITAEGKAAFTEWLKQPVLKFQEMKEPFLMKMFFFDRLSRDEVANHLRTQLDLHYTMMDEFRKVEETYRDTLTDYQKLIAEVGLIYMEFRILWLTRLRQLLEGNRIDGRHGLIPEGMRGAVQAFFLALFSDGVAPEIEEALERLRAFGGGARRDSDRDGAHEEAAP
ncbi:MAG: PadR family transcriptional regulator [bacterium]